MQADPGQQNDVADVQPEAVQRLRDFYDEWWSELEPTFADAAAIYWGTRPRIRHGLTAHDWITTGSTPWNHAHILDALAGDENTGFWNVEYSRMASMSFDCGAGQMLPIPRSTLGLPSG